MHTKEHETRARILRVATEHFASAGYHGASLRKITLDARANLAAVNYHFRSKETLYCEALASVLRPLNHARLQTLNHATELAGDNLIPLELLIKIFTEPLFELCGSSLRPENFRARLVGRYLSEPVPFAQPFLANEQQAFTARFARAIRRHVPRLSASEFMWRLSFVVGALHHMLATMHRMHDLTQGLCRSDDGGQTVAHFVDFALRTIRTPEASK